MSLTLVFVKEYKSKSGKSNAVAVFGPYKELYSVFSELGRFNKNLTYKGKTIPGWVFKKDQSDRIETIVSRFNSKKYNEKEELVLTKILTLLKKKDYTIDNVSASIDGYTKEFIKFVIENNIDYINAFLDKQVNDEDQEEQQEQEEKEEEEEQQEQEEKEEEEEQQEEIQEEQKEQEEKEEEEEDQEEQKEEKEEEKEEIKEKEEEKEEEEQEEIKLSKKEKRQYAKILSLLEDRSIVFQPETEGKKSFYEKSKVFISELKYSFIKKIFTQNSPYIDEVFETIASSKIEEEKRDPDVLVKNFSERNLDPVQLDNFQLFTKMIEIEKHRRDRQPVYKKEYEE